MKPNQQIMKLDAAEPGRIIIRAFQTKNPKNYFTKLTQRFMQCPSVRFKLLSKGTRAENQIAASLGSLISMQQIPEVIQKLAGTQFSLSCELQPDNIPIEIVFNLYDDNIELSCPDFLEEQIMVYLSDEAN